MHLSYNFFTPYVEIWLIVGFCFIIMEFVIIPNIGLLFIGLGALTLSGVLYFDPELISYQFGILGIGALLWFLVLWWPLKIMIYGKHGANTTYDNKWGSDFIGTKVMVVEKPLEFGQMGQVTWSGTIMNAQYVDHENGPALVADMLYVREVKGNVLFCSKTEPDRTSV